jgi:hypothetical protein
MLFTPYKKLSDCLMRYIDTFAADASTDYSMSLGKNAFRPKNKLGNRANTLTDHVAYAYGSCRLGVDRMHDHSFIFILHYSLTFLQ